MNEYNPEVMAMARAIMLETIPHDDYAARGIAYEAAALAIVRTSELAAVYLNLKHGMPTHDYEPGFSDIQALRTFSHLPPVAPEKDA